MLKPKGFLLALLLLLAPAASAVEAWPDGRATSCVPSGFLINPDETGIIYIDIADNSYSSSEVAQDSFIWPVDGVAKNIRVEASSAPGGSEVWEIAILKDGVATALLCTITGAATTCNSGSLSASFLAGEDMTIRVRETGPGSPAATGEMKIAVCFSGAG